MGFENFKSEAESSDHSSRSTNSSSSSSGGRVLSRKKVPYNSSEEHYPFYYDETPQAAVVGGEDGLEWRTWPDTPSIRWAKSSPDDKWEKEDDSHLKRVWWNELDFQRVKQIVEAELDADLIGLLKDDVEKADEAIERAINQHGWSEQEFSNSRTCPVCQDEIDLTYGDYEGIGTEIVCKTHTVEELADEDVI
jgi:hypothetical protein